jgi:antitoxin component of MazEF toxin-antitoxin module
MPIKRKVCRIGTGLAVFLPKSWITLIEEKQGAKVEAVTLEVDGELRIKPVLNKRRRCHDQTA